MFAPELLRIAALEVLCPTRAIANDFGFPTLAGALVFDSRAVPVTHLRKARGYVPVLSLYSGEAAGETMGGKAGGPDFDFMGTLEVVGELAIVSDMDPKETMPLKAESDPDARLVLAGMMAQARYALETAEGGSMFRAVTMSLQRVELVPYAVPDADMRFHRTTMRMTYDLPDDCFDTQTGKPVGLDNLLAALPPDSVSREKMQALLDHFEPPERVLLDTPDIMQGEIPETIVDREDPNL